MLTQNHELLIEIWARLKSHIQPKEKFEAAERLMSTFDDFNMVDDTILEEDLDKELTAAAKSLLAEYVEYEEEDADDTESW